MNYLSIEKLSKQFGERHLFREISFGISQGQKVALLGINGSGKSTLLKIIMGQIEADEGEVSFRKDIRVAFLGQNPDFMPNHSILDAIFDGDNKELAIIREYEYHLHRSEQHPESQEKLMELIGQMDAAQLWDFESYVKQVMGQLGIHDTDRIIESLSGGQKKRVGLAKVLIQKPDFLVLDEPTNHLDLETIEWLEQYLSTQNMSLLLVTHDRYFLERVTNEIKELSGEALHSYKGNYSYFLEKKAERELQEEVEIGKARSLMKKELDWIRRQPKARGTKAKYRIDAFEATKEKAHKKVDKSQMKLEVNGRRLGGKILELDHISKSYGDLQVIQDFSYIFKRGERIGIVGKNGVGKSTFLNLLTGSLSSDTGKVEKGGTIEFGYYTQDELDFKPGQKVIDIVKEIADVVTMGKGQQVSASQFLQHFQFPPKKQHDFVEKLSGGEKRRLQLLRVLIGNPNFLILDEPTNDLDLTTLGILEDFLQHFQGCILLVSHDRYFMDRLVDHIFVLEKEKPIKDFPGNYTQYREAKLAEEQSKESTQDLKAKTEPKSEKTKTVQKRKLSFKERQEFEGLEKEISDLEQKKERIVEQMNIGSGSHDELMTWGRELKELDVEIEAKELRWLELSEIEG